MTRERKQLPVPARVPLWVGTYGPILCQNQYIYTYYIYIYRCRYIFNAQRRLKSEAFASDSVLNLGWDSRRLRFSGFVLAFSTAFLEGRARRAPTGVLPCARLGVYIYG